MKPKNVGNYIVKVYNGNDCISVSDPFKLEPSSVTLKVGTTSIYSFPNPVKDQLQIYRKDDLQKKISITISDSKGIVLIEDVIVGSLTSIDVHRLPAGIYIATLRDDKNRVSFQFMKSY